MSSEFDQLHRETFRWVSKELGVDSRIQCPYLWYISPDEIDEIEKDFLIQVGMLFSPQFKQGIFTDLTQDNRVGLTAILYAKGTTIFPGIILNKNWPRVISHPDRILLQENINSVLTRSSPLYQVGLDIALLQASFGAVAFNVRDLLVNFSEQVGTDLTEIYSERRKIQGEYLDDHPYSVDLSGLAILPTTSREHEIAEEIKRTSPSRVLGNLLNRATYNPAKQARKLFSAYYDGMAHSSPVNGNALRQQADRILRACDKLTTSNPPVLVKVVDGTWTRTSTRRLIQH